MVMISSDGLEGFSLRGLAKSLGVDPAAIYRHVDDVDDLLREVADLALEPVIRRFATTDDPRDDVRRLLTRLRSLLLSSGVARLSAAGPTRLTNELQITEIMLESFARCGLTGAQAVRAYHVLIEYAVGSAALDAPLAASGSERAATYRRWRADYSAVDPEQYPAIRAHARQLYPSSDVVFRTGLDALIAQLLG